MTSNKEIPSPKMLLVEARGVPSKDAPIDLESYADVIGELRLKHYSFGKISEWLGEKLERKINKGAVFRVFQEWNENRLIQEAEDNADVGYDGPEEDEGDNFICNLANQIISYARNQTEEEHMPEFMANSAIEQAYQIIQQQKDDERAANAADAEKQEDDSK